MRDKFDKNPGGPNPYKEPKIRTFLVLIIIFERIY